MRGSQQRRSRRMGLPAALLLCAQPLLLLRLLLPSLLRALLLSLPSQQQLQVRKAHSALHCHSARLCLSCSLCSALLSFSVLLS